jgi:hypothetical protein
MIIPSAMAETGNKNDTNKETKVNKKILIAFMVFSLTDWHPMLKIADNKQSSRSQDAQANRKVPMV